MGLCVLGVCVLCLCVVYVDSSTAHAAAGMGLGTNATPPAVLINDGGEHCAYVAGVNYPRASTATELTLLRWSLPAPCCGPVGCGRDIMTS